MKRKWLTNCLAAIMVAVLSIVSLGDKDIIKAISSDNGDGTFSNPVIFADVPDEDIIRVDDAYYMISTTMHMSPGAPIMKSYDLVNWEIVNYVYDYLEEDDVHSLKNGKSDYAYGSWAASLRYDKYQKKYYVTFSSQTTPKSYFFVTDDIENGSWHRSETAKCYDSSFLFVDTGTKCEKYMIIPVSKKGTKEDGSTYDYNQTEICDLIVNEETWDISLGSKRTLLIENNNVENPPAGLAAEGVHAYKIGEYYYFFMIQGANNPVRQQICWRSKTLEKGSFEVKKVFTGGIVDEKGKEINKSWGVAQGGIVQTPEGKWYSIMFQDYHSVGRIPVLVPVVWGDDGWPVFGNNGKSVNKVLTIPVTGHEKKSIVQSDEFDNGTVRKIYDKAKQGTEITAGIPLEKLNDNLKDVEKNEYGYNGSNLKLEWQWNHNPNNNLWSLTEREGYLRLKSGVISKNIRKARNTLTQRTFGPTSSATTAIEVDKMQEGDVAGLTAFQNQYGFVGVKMQNGKKYLVMHRAQKAGDAAGKEMEVVELTQNRVYLKVNCDFRENTKINSTWRMRDQAFFYYSLDNVNWIPIGDKLKMSYDWPDFMGYRFGLFYYSTKNCGGCVDFDYFHVNSADGKKAELKKIIQEAEATVCKPDCTDEQWNNFKRTLENAKEMLAEIPEDESQLLLSDIEKNYSNVISKVGQAVQALTALPEPAATPIPTVSPTMTTEPKAAMSPGNGGIGGGKQGIISKKVLLKAAGYTLKNKKIYLAKGMKVSLKAEVLPTNTTQKAVTYSSGKKSVASVSTKGVVKAKRPGTAKITVTTCDDGAKAVLTVKVVKKKKVNKDLTVAKKSINVKKGQSVAIKVKKQTAKTTSPIRYQSKNKKVAIVDQFGIIYGKRKGRVKMKIVSGKKSVTVKVNVI